MGLKEWEVRPFDADLDGAPEGDPEADCTGEDPNA